MRIYTFLLIALCLHMAARGQTTWDELDLSGLPQPTQATGLRYWVDDGQVKTLTTAGVYNLDMEQLEDGLHTLHCQVMGSDGLGAYVCSGLFLKMRAASHDSVWANKLMYWYDDETSLRHTDLGQGAQFIDASVLTDGLHTLHYQVLCSNGQMTPTMSSIFLKMDFDNSTTAAKSLRYWYDDQLTATETSIVNGPQALDASMLTDGLHTLHYQVVGDDGTLGVPASALFLKMNSAAVTTPAESLRYWFDDDETTMKVTDTTNGTQTLDVSSLYTGLHTLNYQLIDSEGKVGVPVTRLFFKNFDKMIIEGGNRITKYQYWLNRNSEAMQTVELDDADNPYTLISLLPVQKEPIHSDCFQFEITNDVPTIYAKNIFRIRFHDARDYFIDSEKNFVDYSVKQEVANVEWLESGVRATTAKPVENEIKWYCLNAEPGDSLQFKLNRAATYQLFSPSGQEIYKAYGVESVSWGGCHVRESGTFYLALHDVTATYGNDISIDYNHIDKYAVLRQDVAVVGNGGCSTITFEGNGFRDLYAVDLYNAQGDTIKHVYIGHESDATTSVVFDFTDAVLGRYNAQFHFTEEDKMFTNLITVEEARSIELATTVTYPSTFLRGTSTTYTVKIVNHGNMTAYAVPIELKLITNSIDDIDRIRINGCMNTMSIPEDLLNDTLYSEDIIMIQKIMENISDISQFVVYRDSDNNIDYGLSQLLLDIPPHTIKQFTITFYTTSTVDFEVMLSKVWMPISCVQYNLSRKRNAIAIDKEWMCCYRERIECSIDLIATIAGLFMPPGAGCATNIGTSVINTAYDVWCAEGNNVKEQFDNLVQQSGQSIANRLIQTTISCVTKYFRGRRRKLFDERSAAKTSGNWEEVQRLDEEIDALRAMEWSAIRSIYAGICTSVMGEGCYDAWTKQKPGCPPNPDSGGGPSNPVNSYDPNDVYGYTAESGCKAVRDGLADVYYTIQFENDTTFATVAAHDVYLTDTLDASKFDLSTFAPTRVKIGDKSAELTGEKNFVTTIDMRPEINAIAQVEGTYDQMKGIAKWHITSLDPMTMEPTNEPMDGVLPVNTNGKGIGEVSYDISLKSNLAHGTEINNRAGIVFDQNDVIMTPTWTNIIDRIAPESHVADVQMLNDSTASVSIEASDELSGPWRYNVYVQYGSGAWFLGAENVPIDTTANVKVYEGINHGFYVVVTDSAGNVEQKEAAREFTFEVFGSQIDTNTRIELAEGWNWISHNQQEPLPVSALQPAGSRMQGQTEELIDDTRFGWMGDLEELQPTQMYKLQMDEPQTIQLSGRLFNSGFRSVPLYEGWNWLGYPVANTMTPTEAFAKLEAEEGDMLIGQDGMATYSDGQWTGTLLEMVPGQGFMYRSSSDKNLFYNATAQASARRVNSEQFSVNSLMLAEEWTVDKRKYPNIMGMIAQLVHKDKVADADQWLLGAFCGEECRGVASTVNGVLMMNVYGQGGEPIMFRTMNRETGEILPVAESEPFQANVLGSMQQPYSMHIGEASGISPATAAKGERSIYLLDGRRVSSTASLRKGIYVATDKGHSKTQKVISR